MSETQGTRWEILRVGDMIVCPITGAHERVRRSRRHSGDMWFVRTERHDHIRGRSEHVSKVLDAVAL